LAVSPLPFFGIKSSLNLWSLILYPAAALRNPLLYIMMYAVLCWRVMNTNGLLVFIILMTGFSTTSPCIFQDSQKCTVLCFFYQNVTMQASKYIGTVFFFWICPLCNRYKTQSNTFWKPALLPSSSNRSSYSATEYYCNTHNYKWDHKSSTGSQ
jgi:hypothetical protein